MSVKVDLPDWLTMCLMPQIDRLSDLMCKHIDFHLIINPKQISLIHKNLALTYWNEEYPIYIEPDGQRIEVICLEYQRVISVITGRVEEHLQEHHKYIFNKQSRENPLILGCIKMWERSIRELHEVYPVLDLSFRYIFLENAMCFYCECSVSEWKKSFVSEMFYDTIVDGVIALEKLRMRRFLQAVIEKGEQLRENM